MKMSEKWETQFWKEQTVAGRLKILRQSQGLSQENVAKDVKISRSAVGRIENGNQSLNEVTTVLFADYYGISCDTLLRGIKSEHYKIHQITGLTNNSIAWFEKTKQTNPEMMSIVNHVFSNSNIADALFQTFYIYAKLHIPSFIQTDDGTMLGRVSRSLSDEETLLKGVMSDYMHEILTQIRRYYDGERSMQSEIGMKTAIENLEIAITKKHNSNQIKKLKHEQQ